MREMTSLLQMLNAAQWLGAVSETRATPVLNCSAWILKHIKICHREVGDLGETGLNAGPSVTTCWVLSLLTYLR